MKQINVLDMGYGFVSDFKDDPSLRQGFNALAQAVFHFDFEDYYRSGYWNERYIPYALTHEGRVVANVSANVLDFSVCGEIKRYLQIGTVMTDAAYRGQGLCRYLLETVIHTWQEKSTLIYLFANDSVLDFYPKFGFQVKTEFQYEKQVKTLSAPRENRNSIRRLDMDTPQDRKLLFRLVDGTQPFSRLTALHNTSLVLFYATSFMKEHFYYIEAWDAAVFAEYDGTTLHLNDVFCARDPLPSLEELIALLARPETQRIVLGFTPLTGDANDFLCKNYHAENDTLFVLSKDKSVFDTCHVMLPLLSHA